MSAQTDRILIPEQYQGCAWYYCTGYETAQRGEPLSQSLGAFIPSDGIRAYEAGFKAGKEAIIRE